MTWSSYQSILYNYYKKNFDDDDRGYIFFIYGLSIIIWIKINSRWQWSWYNATITAKIGQNFQWWCVSTKFIHALTVNESNFKILFVLLYVKLKIITTLFTIYFLSGSVPLPILHKIPDYYYIYTTIANIYFFRIHFIFMYSTLCIPDSRAMKG